MVYSYIHIKIGKYNNKGPFYTEILQYSCKEDPSFFVTDFNMGHKIAFLLYNLTSDSSGAEPDAWPRSKTCDCTLFSALQFFLSGCSSFGWA